MHPDHSTNRISWDELAALHGNDAYYDADALVAGASSLIEEEEAALMEAVGRDLVGLRILHLQCHLGFDAITFARRGAHVTGVDFSSVAIARAERLAAQCGVRIDWVCADATELPDVLSQEFDLVWATMGVLCWIADLRAWMQGVATVLIPGGRLVLIDGWPEDDPGETGEAGALRSDGIPARRFLARGWDYATRARTSPQVQFRHSLRAIVSAARRAGLRVERLHEHTAISTDLCIEHVIREEDGRYRRRVEGKPRPVLYTLAAVRLAPTRPD